MSKIWTLLRSTHVIRRMLRYINWCILFVVICASLTTVPIFSSSSVPATVDKQQTRNSTESRLFVVVDHTWVLGVALASFLLNVKLNVSLLFLRLLLLIVRRKRREVGRLLVAFAPHSKRTQKNQDTQKTFARRQGTI